MLLDVILSAFLLGAGVVAFFKVRKLERRTELLERDHAAVVREVAWLRGRLGTATSSPVLEKPEASVYDVAATAARSRAGQRPSTAS